MKSKDLKAFLEKTKNGDITNPFEKKVIERLDIFINLLAEIKVIINKGKDE